MHVGTPCQSTQLLINSIWTWLAIRRATLSNLRLTKCILEFYIFGQKGKWRGDSVPSRLENWPAPVLNLKVMSNERPDKYDH